MFLLCSSTLDLAPQRGDLGSRLSFRGSVPGDAKFLNQTLRKYADGVSDCVMDQFAHILGRQRGGGGGGCGVVAVVGDACDGLIPCDGAVGVCTSVRRVRFWFSLHWSCVVVVPGGIILCSYDLVGFPVQHRIDVVLVVVVYTCRWDGVEMSMKATGELLLVSPAR